MDLRAPNDRHEPGDDAEHHYPSTGSRAYVSRALTFDAGMGQRILLVTAPS
jgi:hypothetical protein